MSTLQNKLLATFILLLLLPLLLFLALLVRLTSKGPVFYKQQRLGYFKQPFSIYKFRTMKPNPAEPFKAAKPGDTRITKLGGFLRKTNTLIGEDFIVGAKFLAAGYSLAYVAEATAIHSHDYTPLEELKHLA